ncbi:hypothetical protein HMPREF0872_04015 [Veillonella montpellierensis DNF00314]|uniref:Uncharacterized protein n=1 Tax=Veillonella montpellierensis DNF00314 TaxID=1401067 RepID=A0A096BXV0_9FIRM|nr:hypothetical protein [Veillonella montpellierensis]KGF47567.1 hypothetical protein HMPREF0872_04015 [Veillonella montpellierensis DNF00314]
MVIVNDKGTKILDCVSIFISERADKDDKSKAYCYDIKCQLSNGRVERIKSFDDINKAYEFISLLYRDFGASIRALEDA